MKKLLIVLAAWIAVAPFQARAAILGAPFIPEIDQRFNALEGDGFSNSHNILNAQPQAVVVYDFAAAGGSTFTSPVVLPPNAFITRSYFQIGSSAVGSGASIAWTCGVAGNILATTAINTLPTSGFLEGVSTGASTLFKDVGTSACNIKMTVTGAPLTAGKISAYLEFAVHQ